MLASLSSVLAWAEENGCAAAAFDTPNLELLLAAIGAAEHRGEPVIIQHAQLHEEETSIDVIGPIMVARAEASRVPVCVMLDHGEDMDLSLIHILKHDGYMDAVAVKQTDVFAAAVEFARLETILPAPESAHAIFQAMEEARRCAETGEEKTILFGLTGTGYFDMKAYDAYNRGEMSDHVPTDEELEVGFASIPHIEGVQ